MFDLGDSLIVGSPLRLFMLLISRTGCSYHKHSSLFAAQGISDWIHVHVGENSRCQYSIVHMIVDDTVCTYSTAKIALMPA